MLDELNELYLNLKKNNVGGFADYHYWSSSESVSPFAWSQFFGNGSQDIITFKHIDFLVRAVRSF